MIPQPPTDNLYKFLAISGLITIGASSIFYEKYDNDLIERKIDIDRTSRILAAKSESEAAQSEINSLITEGKAEILKTQMNMALMQPGGISKQDTQDHIDAIEAQEQNLRRLHEIKLSLSIEQIEQNADEHKLKLLEKRASHVKLVALISSAFGIFMSFLGFTLWYTRSQKFIDESVRNGFHTHKQSSDLSKKCRRHSGSMRNRVLRRIR